MSVECKHPGCDNTVYRRGYCNPHEIRSRRGSDMDRPLLRRGSDPERFWQKVDKSDACWEWNAFRDSAGYGRFMIDGVPNLAHRVSFARVVGPIPEGAEVDHLCHNRACVNPSHLRLVDRWSNAQNMSGARSDSASGARGVSLCASGKWQARATVRGEAVSLGRFESLEEAEAAITEWRRTNMPYSEMDKKKEVA